ncbi:unnamed protein product [Urochloa decumbens]|uniref:NB-ARC domain-containing protein n=1 Tax=Urochloa decumbens TaxID=240449 RepID=A0ABC9CIK7_9POAL
MEIIVSAITGELVARSVSFLMDRYLNWTAPTDDSDRLLQRLLLRAQVIVEEAEGRRITTHAMLRQLAKLREDVYRGCYALDMSSRRRDRELSRRRSSALSRSNPCKRVCLMARSDGDGRLQDAVGSLETTIADMSEFVVFLTGSGCPRLGRQPYSAYMFMDKCMFGRQMEMERVVAFLLEEETSHGGSSRREPGVLAILGPKRAGKSTLVEHACNDERVRDHFSQILSFTFGDLKDDGSSVSLRRSGGAIKHRRHIIDEERVLVIVELDGERNTKGLDETIMESSLRGFYSTYKTRIPCATKIIVTSRSEKIASFATTEPLRLRPLSREAFWYFFKVRVFGSTDAADHPKLASIAMDMADEVDGSFAAASIFGELVRSNFNPQFWSLALAVLREFKKRNLIKYDAHQRTETDALEIIKPSSYTKEAAEEFVHLDDYQINSSTRGEVPKISLQDILFGGARPQGKFDVLGWKSTIPPYYSYAYRCEIQRPQRMVARKNRGRKIGNS